MPIIIDNEGKENERIRVYFDGNGDIRVSPATWNMENERYNILCFSQTDEPHEIGEYGENPPGTTSDDLNVKVKLEFEKPESVDVVIEELKKIKLNLIANTVWTVNE